MRNHSPFSQKSALVVYFAIALLSALVFGVDMTIPLGVTAWMFYILPVVLCIHQSRPALPYLVAALEAVLLIVGYFSVSSDLRVEVAITNRLIGIAVVFGVAALARSMIVERNRTRRLLWLEQGRAEVSRSLIGQRDSREVADNALQALAHYTDAQVGMLHIAENGSLMPLGSYAIDLPAQASGRSLAAEVADEGRIMVVRDLPDGYLPIASGTGSGMPRHLLIAPVTADGTAAGAIELGFLRRSADFELEIELMKMVAEKIGIGIRSARYREHLQQLLERTQSQSEELQAQQEELRVANEELQEQSRALHESRAVLEARQRQVEQVNTQLEERTELLERQKEQLLRTQRLLEDNAVELRKANRYKAEFLANMSHELRTPLNSSLILSHMLVENRQSTLTEEQIKYARTIHAANKDLLNLINDILDLSKIESGQTAVQPEAIALDTLTGALRQTFEPVAAQKALTFELAVAADAPHEIVSDAQRLQQILRNLLANAFKFTERGRVALEIVAAPGGRIGFAVSDTGIGIPEHQQEVIFEAFRQADGSISRTYGGTGLGLSISRQLAHLLGGEIRVRSTPGQGSTFTLELPQRFEPADDMPAAAPTVPQQPVEIPTPGSEASAETAIPDDRFNRRHGRSILVVEDDDKFALALCELVHEMRFDYLHAPSGAVALRAARELQPDAMLLDVRLPDCSGLSVLDRIKRDPAVRHIPVHMISVDDYRQAALELGAVGYAIKPVAREEITQAIRKLEDRLVGRHGRVLIVEDNAELRESLADMLGATGTEIVGAGTAADALRELANSAFDCMVMDLMLPDASGHDLLREMAKGGGHAFPPVIVYTGRAMSREEEQQLRRYSQSIIIKGARSPERLLDEVSLFLHRVESALPTEQQQMLARARRREAVFEGRRILVAEDDVRNIFALTSVFEPLGAELVITRNGREALERLEHQDIDLVLMDLMMPEMDGLTAIREIRRRPPLKGVPVIALTAKAMSNDRKDALDAGANDYIAKPIDVDQLVSLCRVWMPK